VILLFDQNLSPQLTKLLSDLFPGSLHVRELGMEEASDPKILEYARQHGAAVVSKDSGFGRWASSRPGSPKIIWVRLGNCSTARIADALRRHAIRIQQLASDPAVPYLTIL
jgi:predicted nuclease of predicted toxin-antitoxin system